MKRFGWLILTPPQSRNSSQVLHLHFSLQTLRPLIQLELPGRRLLHEKLVQKLLVHLGQQFRKGSIQRWSGGMAVEDGWETAGDEKANVEDGREEEIKTPLVIRHFCAQPKLRFKRSYIIRKYIFRIITYSWTWAGLLNSGLCQGFVLRSLITKPWRCENASGFKNVRFKNCKFFETF